MDRFGPTEKMGAPFEVDHFSRLDLLEFWLNRDRGDHFKVVGLKTLANIKKHSGRCFAIYLAFARHLIYHLNKYNINVHTCYTIQYSQYVK